MTSLYWLQYEERHKDAILHPMPEQAERLLILQYTSHFIDIIALILFSMAYPNNLGRSRTYAVKAIVFQ